MIDRLLVMSLVVAVYIGDANIFIVLELFDEFLYDKRGKHRLASARNSGAEERPALAGFPCSELLGVQKPLASSFLSPMGVTILIHSVICRRQPLKDGEPLVRACFRINPNGIFIKNVM